MEERQAHRPSADSQGTGEAHPGVQQAQRSDLRALCMLARLHQIAADPQTLAHQLGLQSSDPASVQDLLRAAKHLGLKARLSRCDAMRLPLMPLPALALVRSQQAGACRSAPRLPRTQ